VRKLLRCAIYTRVSSDQRLEQDFNSLDAQREAAEAYIKSQSHEGWRLRRHRYDDGGFSGGSMDRPALSRLLADIRTGCIDVVVVYKVDRLTRSLADFAKLVELFDSQSVSFVSVTQSFNTTSSMGRLTLNVLLSFAQFEREVTGERIRDKIGASKRKGLWMGGVVPMGYRVDNRKLVIDKEEAATVKNIFQRYLALRSITKLQAELRLAGVRTRTRVLASGRILGNVHLTNGPLAYILRNRMYLGEINHRGKSFPAEHEPIIEREVFDAVQNILSEKPDRHDRGYNRSDALLGGLLFDDRGNRMSPSHALKNGVRYNYYVSTPAIQGRKQDSGTVSRVPASAIEEAVSDALRARCGQVKLSDLPDGQSVKGLLRDVQRIELRADRILFEMRAANALGRAIDAEQDPELDPGISASIVVPWRPPCSHRKRDIILPVGAKSKSEVKPLRNEERLKLLRAIEAARRWCEALLPVPQAGIGVIAARHGKTESWVRKHLTLAFLDPKLVEAAVDGILPSGYGPSRFLDLPADWNDQWRVLGLRNLRDRAPAESQQ